MTDVAIRQAGRADLAALARLRREQAAEQQGEYGDPGFEQRFAAWQEREAARRSVPFYQRAGFGPAGTLLLWTP